MVCMGIIFFDNPRHFLEADTFCLLYNPWCLHTLVCMSLPISAWPPAQDPSPPFSVPAHQPIALSAKIAHQLYNWLENFHLFLELTRTFCILVTVLLIYVTWYPVGPSVKSGAKWLTLFPCRVGGELIISLVADGIYMPNIWREDAHIFTQLKMAPSCLPPMYRTRNIGNHFGRQWLGWVAENWRRHRIWSLGLDSTAEDRMVDLERNSWLSDSCCSFYR